MGEARTYTGEFPPDGSHTTVNSLVAALSTSVERVRVKYAIAVRLLENRTANTAEEICGQIDRADEVVGLVPYAVPETPADPSEFWVVHDKHEGTAIWWWDGTKLVLLIHHLDVVYGNATDPGVQRRRGARERLWDHITRDIPVAPPCQHEDGCKDVAITHPQYCPAHIPEEV